MGNLPNKQIGWSQESNLLWEILKQLTGLEGTMGMLTDVVPSSRTLTINGVSQDLSADRTWTVLGTAIGVVPSYSFLPAAPGVPGEFYWAENPEGTQWLPGALGGTYYNAGLYYSNGIEWTYMETPYQAIQAEVDAGVNFNKFVTPLTFNNAAKWNTKQGTLTLTTIGTSGPATLIGDVLNIPQYTGGGGGGATNLGYIASPTQGEVTSSTGTSAILPLADGINAGLISPANFTKIDSLNVFTATVDGLVPAPITVAGSFLNDGGNWISPADIVASGQTGTFTWKYNTNINPADPGNGFFRANNATPSLITQLFIDDITSNNQVDISNIFSQIKGNWTIYIQQRNDATKWIEFSTSVPYIDNTGWWTVPVTYLQGGTGGGIDSSTDCLFLFLNKNSGNATATGTVNRIAKFTSANILGDSSLTDTGTLITSPVDMLFTGGKGVILQPAVVGTNRDIKFFGSSNIDNFAGASYYPNTGTNVGSTFTMIPRGAGYTATIKSQIAVFNTDFIADGFNYEFMAMRAAGANFSLATGKNAAGILRPLLLSAGFADAITNPNQLWLYTSGNVGVNTTSDAGFRFDVQGTTRLGNTVTLQTAPTTSAGTYDILTRNTGTGVVEKVLSSTFALDTDVLHKAGNETFTGTKSYAMTNAGANPGGPALNITNGFNYLGAIQATNTSNGYTIYGSNSGLGAVIGATNTNTSGGSAFYGTTGANGIAFKVQGSGGVTGITHYLADTVSLGSFGFRANNGVGTGVYVTTSGAGFGVRINNETGATGKPFQYTKNAIEQVFLNDAGQWNSIAYIKTGAPATNILLANGTDIPQSTFALSTTTLDINGVVQNLSANRQWRTGLADTGALTYGGITVASPTTVNIGAATGVIVNNETTPGTPTYTLINYPGELNKTVTTIAGGPGTYVLLNSAGTIVFQNTFPTSAQRKTHIYLSKISHPDLATISFALNEVDFVTSPLQQFRDVFQAIQYMKIGIVAVGNAGLTINHSNGEVIGDGINFVADRTMPNTLTIGASNPTSFLLLNQTGAAGGFVTTVDPANYDVAGVTTPVGGGTNNSTIQYLYFAPGVGFAIQRGQTVYPTLVDAVAAVGREAYVVRPNLVNNSILIAAICMRHTTTNMNDTSFVRILPSDKFGQIGGAASGISVSTFQTIYGNSVIPQLTTTSLLGAVTYRRGSAADTDNVFVIQNGAGTNTFAVTGNGLINAANLTTTGAITGSAFVKAGGLASEFLKANGVVDSTVYAADSTVIHNTGNESFTGTKSGTTGGAVNPSISITNAISSTLSAGINVSNTGTGAAYKADVSSGRGINFTVTGTGTGIVLATTSSNPSVQITHNNAAGNGFILNNVSTSTGMQINNQSTGIGLLLNNSIGTGKPFSYVENTVEKAFMDTAGNMTAMSFNVTTGPTGDAFIANTPAGYFGNMFEGNNDSINVFKVDQDGFVEASGFITTGGTGSNFVLGNGSLGTATITITTAVSITSATLGTNSQPQYGRNVIIDNGANAINYTINGILSTSFFKAGTASITFVAGAGRTIVQMNGTLVLSGIAGSTASIQSVGTVDYLYITNY